MHFFCYGWNYRSDVDGIHAETQRLCQMTAFKFWLFHMFEYVQPCFEKQSKKYKWSSPNGMTSVLMINSLRLLYCWDSFSIVKYCYYLTFLKLYSHYWPGLLILQRKTNATKSWLSWVFLPSSTQAFHNFHIKPPRWFDMIHIVSTRLEKIDVQNSLYW